MLFFYSKSCNLIIIVNSTRKANTLCSKFKIQYLSDHQSYALCCENKDAIILG